MLEEKTFPMVRSHQRSARQDCGILLFPRAKGQPQGQLERSWGVRPRTPLVVRPQILSFSCFSTRMQAAHPQKLESSHYFCFRIFLVLVCAFGCHYTIDIAFQMSSVICWRDVKGPDVDDKDWLIPRSATQGRQVVTKGRQVHPTVPWIGATCSFPPRACERYLRLATGTGTDFPSWAHAMIRTLSAAESGSVLIRNKKKECVAMLGPLCMEERSRGSYRCHFCSRVGSFFRTRSRPGLVLVCSGSCLGYPKVLKHNVDSFPGWCFNTHSAHSRWNLHLQLLESV